MSTRYASPIFVGKSPIRPSREYGYGRATAAIGEVRLQETTLALPEVTVLSTPGDRPCFDGGGRKPGSGGVQFAAGGAHIRPDRHPAAAGQRKLSGRRCERRRRHRYGEPILYRRRGGVRSIPGPHRCEPPVQHHPGDRGQERGLRGGVPGNSGWRGQRRHAIREGTSSPDGCSGTSPTTIFRELRAGGPWSRPRGSSPVRCGLRPRRTDHPGSSLVLRCLQPGLLVPKRSRCRAPDTIRTGPSVTSWRGT